MLFADQKLCRVILMQKSTVLLLQNSQSCSIIQCTCLINKNFAKSGCHYSRANVRMISRICLTIPGLSGCIVCTMCNLCAWLHIDSLVAVLFGPGEGLGVDVSQGDVLVPLQVSHQNADL